MSYLDWNLDMEEEANLYDPIGNLKIIGDKGTIVEDYTYLDAFFEAFAKGIERLKVEDVVIVDPLIEPNDIIFHRKNNLLEIEYGNQKTVIFNELEFTEEFKNAVIKLIGILDEFAVAEKKQSLKLTILRNFVK